MDAIVTGSGNTRMADQDVCIAVGEDLTKHYPGHLWMVGCDHNAGVLHIRLQLPTRPELRDYGYLLHISTVLGADGQKAVMRAGGEMLERFGLARSAAKADTDDMAFEHGLDTTNNKNKSRH